MNHDDKKKYFELLALKILKEYQNVEIEKLIHDEKTFTKFRRLFCQISRNVINDKAAFFYFSRKDVIPMWQMYYIKRKQNERRKSQ